MRSKFLSLNWRDFFRGLFYAIFSALIAFLYNWLQSGSPLDKTLLPAIVKCVIATLLVYLSANLFQNSEGKFFVGEG